MGIVFVIFSLLFVYFVLKTGLGFLAMLFGFFPNDAGGWEFDPGAWLGFVAIFGCITLFVIYA